MYIKIMEIPDDVGSKLSFEFPLSTERLKLPYVISFIKVPIAKGEIIRKSDSLWVECEINSELLCTCDRCAAEYKRAKCIEISVPVIEIEDGEEEEGAEFFYAGRYFRAGRTLRRRRLFSKWKQDLCAEKIAKASVPVAVST